MINKTNIESERVELDPVSSYIKDIGEKEVLSRNEEYKLAVRIAAGDKEAFNEMVEHNLKLVYSIARYYSESGADFDDLAQEGVLGLIKAVEKFDYTKGFKFSTYAVWWIRQSILSYLGNNRNIRIPAHVQEKMSKINKAKRKFFFEREVEPNIKELSLETGFSEKEIKTIMCFSPKEVSLDAPVGEDDDSSIGDFIEQDKHENDPENRIASCDIASAMRGLSDKEKEIIELHFGLNGKEQTTLSEIKKQYGLSLERVRQIEKGALQKMKCSLGKDYLFAA